MSGLLAKINTLLTPLENILKTYKKYIGYFFIGLSVLSLGLVVTPSSVKFTGEQSLNFLWYLLFLPIFARVLGLSLARALMSLRKEVGIFMGTLAFVHGITYLAPDYTYIFTSSFWIDNTTYISYLAFGFLALSFTIPLTLTSSTWMMKKMGKYWKILHRTVYIIIILTVIHVVLLKWYREFEIGQVLLLAVYFGFKLLEWKGFSFAKKDVPKVYPKGQKWFCVPCGYIYDPALGDEADGIKAGTEFSDISDSWRCPECGVTKADFVPVEDTMTLPTGYDAHIVEKTLLNSVTLRLVIELKNGLKSVPGQFVTFMWSDSEGEFSRSYSIAEHDGQKLTFFIKLTELGRGARVLRDISPDATIRIRGIFGRFVLQDTENPKIFIATGTGLAPIYNMIRSLRFPVIPGLTRDPSGNKNISGTPGFLPSQEGQKSQVQLYFTVAIGAELFYIDELRAIEGLELHIHTTKEEIPGYAYGRVNVDDIVATPDTEWYLCGSPRMVSETREKLSARGYEKVYSEEFN